MPVSSYVTESVLNEQSTPTVRCEGRADANQKTFTCESIARCLFIVYSIKK